MAPAGKFWVLSGRGFHHCGWGFGGWRFRNLRAGRAVFFGLGLEEARERRGGFVEHADELARGCIENAEERGEEHVPRWKIGDGSDLFGGDDGPIDDADLEGRHLELRSEGFEHLCGGGDIAISDDDRRLALEFTEFRQAGAGGGTLEEGVFDDTASGSGIPEAVTEFGELGAPGRSP